MATKTAAVKRVPFNLRDEDAEQFEKMRREFEDQLSTRLSAVQFLRVLMGNAPKKIRPLA